ncbi:MAG: nucleotide exchange factor GrpE [bacterium]|nr:nucleotide exchange factor GrpE [bacterium]
MTEELEKNETQSQESVTPEETITSEEYEKLKLELIETKQQLEAANQEILRRIAEFQTFQRRKNQEIQAIRKYGAEELIKSFIPALNDLDRSVAHVDSASEKTLKDALVMLQKRVENILNRFGVEKIAPQKGDRFDPNLHDAIAKLPTEEAPENTIMDVAENGWKLHDHLLDPAKVVVATALKEITVDTNSNSDEEFPKTPEES